MEAEAQLLARCRRGDSDAWDELFDRHYAAAGRFIYQLAPDFTREDVEEICQEAFLSVIRNLKSFQGSSQFQTWLFRIAANKTRDYRERRQAAKRGGGQTPISLDAEDPDTGLRIDPPSPTSAPDAELMNVERTELVREALDQLGEPCREIIELRYFGDLSYEELSRELQLNPKTVSSRLSKCLDRLEEIARAMILREKSGVFPSNLSRLMNDERPIEKLLRRSAKKRRDDAGAALELPSVTRRILQGEAARQFPKQVPANVGALETLAQVWKSWRARLIWSLPVLIVLGVGIGVLLETHKKSDQEMALARNPSPPAGAAGEVENSFKALESPVPKWSAPTPSLAEAHFDRKKSETTVVSTEPRSGADLSGELLQRRRNGVALAEASPVVSPKKTMLHLGSANGGVNKPSEPAGQEGAPNQLFAAATPPPRAQSKVGDGSIQTPGLAVSTPTEAPLVASFGTSTVYAMKAERNLAPAEAPTETTANYDKLATRVAGKRERVQFQANSQIFANRASDASDAKIEKAGAPSPVLARFEVKQRGDQLRVIDSDGSIYVGEMQMPAATQSTTVAAEKKDAQQLKDLAQIANDQLAETPLPNQQQTQSFSYRVVGTNRTLNEQVIFTWNFVPQSNQLAAAQITATSGGGTPLQNQQATRQLSSFLNNSDITGRALLGSGKAIEINAVPVTR